MAGLFAPAGAYFGGLTDLRILRKDKGRIARLAASPTASRKVVKVVGWRDRIAIVLSVLSFLLAGWLAYYQHLNVRYDVTVALIPSLPDQHGAFSHQTLAFTNNGNQPLSVLRASLVVITKFERANSAALQSGDKCGGIAGDGEGVSLRDKNFRPAVLKPGEIENMTLNLRDTDWRAQPGDRFIVCMLLTHLTHRLGISHTFSVLYQTSIPKPFEPGYLSDPNDFMNVATTPLQLTVLRRSFLF